MNAAPDFRSNNFLREHILTTMAFYDKNIIDPNGGCFQFFRNDGSIYDKETRHLVSSTRFVFNFAMAYRHFKKPEWLESTKHALKFLREVHLSPKTGGYAWQLKWQDGKRIDDDNTNHCYGLAFVLLAYAHALMAGIEEARSYIDETWDLMEKRFWEPQHGLYADEADENWNLKSYRGQNANMHSCEAMLAAYEATGQTRFLDRAALLAENITVRQAKLAGGFMWEHYHQDWSVDWEYNLHDKTNIFRPWGYQPGHLTEWAKLLLILEKHRLLPWLLPKAESLFSEALKCAWDDKNGGICYGFAPDRSICDGDKYFWVQAESFAAAARLATRTGKNTYWEWYQRIWEYSWRHMIDHKYGAWYRILTQNNRSYSDEKSPAGKTDYHTMGACYEVLSVLGEKG